jgi:hypothetical protein
MDRTVRSSSVKSQNFPLNFNQINVPQCNAMGYGLMETFVTFLKDNESVDFDWQSWGSKTARRAAPATSHPCRTILNQRNTS